MKSEKFETFKEAISRKKEIQQGRSCGKDPFIKDEDGYYVLYWESDDE